MTVKLNKVVILIEGLTCSSCVSTVENTLKDLKSVTDVKVSLATNSCSLEYDSSILSIDSVLNEIENIGYTAKLLTQDHLQASESHPVVRELTLNVTGMTCSSCASTIETALSQLNGVESVVVILATNSAMVGYDPQKISSSAVIAEIESNGYAATVIKDSFISSSEQAKKKKIKQLLVAVSLGNEISKETAKLKIEQSLLRLECITELEFPLATTHSDGTLLVQVQCNSIFVPSKLVTARMIEDLPGCTVAVVEETITEIAVETDQMIEKVKALLITFTVVDDHSVHDWPTFLSGYASELKMCVGVLSTEEMQEEAQVLVTFNELLTGPRAFFMVAQKAYAKFTNGSRDLAVDGFQISSVGGFMMADRLLKSQNKEMIELRNLFLVALILTMPVLVLAMILPLYPHNKAQETMEINVVSGLTLTNLIQFLLDSPIQWWIGFRFHRRAFFSLKRGTVGMDFIISTGTSAAYFYSLIAVIQQMVKGGRGHAMSDTYFEISAVLITVILLGKYLECYAKGRTASAIHKLSALKSNNARLVGIMPESFMLSTPSSHWPLPENEVHTFSDHTSNDSSADILIDASFLHLYDVVRLVSGESVPGDGVLLSNSHISLDESLLTGESRIISKKEFDSVYGGTIVQDGSALMRITAIGDDSTLGKIIQTIQEAQISKPQIQELAEKFAKIFVPAVICISITTFVIWIIVGSLQIIPDSWDRTRGGPFLFAFTFALAVWVSACPCAFGLATPTAVLVATGVAAKNGILVRRGAALQSASEIDTMAFDKTGTLTRGHTEVTDYYFKASSQQILTVPCLDVFDDDNDKENTIQQHGVLVRTQLQFLNEFWKSLSKQQLTEFYEHLLFLYFTEQKSNHPLALGVSTYCGRMLENLEQYWLLTYGPSGESNILAKLKDDCKHGINGYQFEFIPGQGIHLFFNSSSTESDEPIKDRSPPLLASHCSDLIIGNPSLFVSLNIQLPAVASEIANGLTAVGKVSLFYAVNGIWRGILSLSDKVRPEAVYVIRELRQRNISCFMVTGDQTGTAHAIGSLLGIKSSHILSNARPEDKEMFLAALHQKGAKVGFIGDGNNDGPALARAHVGIVMASGTDIAMESGDMVLCKNDLTALIACLDISRLTLRRIKLNYIWAFGYNCLLIPIAAGVFFPFFQFALQPMWAGAAMAVSSVSVIVSSLTITLFKPKSFVHAMESSTTQNEDLSKNHTCKCPISTIPVLDEQNKNALFGKLNFTSWVPNLLTDGFLHSEKSATELLLEYKAQKLGLNEEDIAKTEEHRSLKTVPELPCTCGAKNCRCSNQCNCGKQFSTVSIRDAENR